MGLHGFTVDEKTQNVCYIHIYIYILYIIHTYIYIYIIYYTYIYIYILYIYIYPHGISPSNPHPVAER